MVQSSTNFTLSGNPAHVVLRDKYPNLKDPLAGVKGCAFESYPQVPLAIPEMAKGELIEFVSAELEEEEGLRGVDVMDLHNWIIRFSTKSEALQEKMAEWED